MKKKNIYKSAPHSNASAKPKIVARISKTIKASFQKITQTEISNTCTQDNKKKFFQGNKKLYVEIIIIINLRPEQCMGLKI